MASAGTHVIVGKSRDRCNGWQSRENMKLVENLYQLFLSPIFNGRRRQRKRWKAREKSNVCQTFVHSFSCLVRALTGGKGRKKHVTGGKYKIKCSDRVACARPRVAGCKCKIMKCVASAGKYVTGDKRGKTLKE